MLLKDETLLITIPDNGSLVAFPNKSDYVDKIDIILDDNLKFQNLTEWKDLNNKIENELI